MEKTMCAKKPFFLALLLVLAVSLQLPAQSSDWYYNKPISTVTFKGLKNIKRSDVEAVTNRFIGKNFTDEVFADLLNRVFALNFFEDVEPVALPGDTDYKSVKIELTVVELPVVTRVRYDGRTKMRLSELKDVTSSKEKTVYDESKRLADERKILELYRSQGFTEATVSSTARRTKDGFEIVFRISEGRKSIVRDISFSGNTIVSDRTLKGKLNLKQNSLISKGYYQEATVEQDKAAILLYYQDHGYIDARIVNVEIESDYNAKKERQEMLIHYNIEEGSMYTFAGISYEGCKIFTPEELVALTKMRVGDVFSLTKLQEGYSAAQSKYYDNGYINARFGAQSLKDTENKTFGYHVYVVEGRRSHIENIIIKGNDRTKDEVILREIPFESGDIFSNAKIMNAYRNLLNLRYFSQVVPEPKPGSEDGLEDIVFNVVEQGTRSVQVGMTFSGLSSTNEFPIALEGALTDSNIGGTGRSLSVSAKASTTSQSASLGYGQNWTFGMPISNRTSLSYSHSSLSTVRNVLLPDGTLDNYSFYMPYDEHKLTFSDYLTRRWTPDFAVVSVTGGFSTSFVTALYDDTIYTPADAGIADYHDGWNTKNSLTAAISMDGRDNYYDPTKGWFVSQSFSWFGLIPQGTFSFLPAKFGETEFFLRSVSTAEQYFSLFSIPVTDTYDLKFILRLESDLSMQFPFFNSTIQNSSLLYIDGVFHGRGWKISGSRMGNGNLVFNNTVELRVPVVPNILAIDTFFDASMVKWEVTSGFNDFFNPEDWYFSYGPGLSLLVQQFPLRLFLVSNFKIENGIPSLKDASGKDLNNWLSTWHFVVSVSSPNR
jgi:outer membrane protein insertion porin family